jgi:hypothetical protein
LNETAQVLPKTWQLSAIPGDAPALAEVSIELPSGSLDLPWALIAWWERAQVGGTPPVGLLEAETGTGLTSWAVTADADYRGGSGLQFATTGTNLLIAQFAGLDPQLLISDDYASEMIDIEVWARVELASTLGTPTIQARTGEHFTHEHGAAFKRLVKPLSGTVFRFVRLGTLPFSINTAGDWTLEVWGQTTAPSSGVFGLDYLVLTPAKSRALAPTGKSATGYPNFISSGERKTVRSDLSAERSFSSLRAPSSGLGGSLLELPPGDVDMLLKLGSIPDSPTVDTMSDVPITVTADVVVTVTPRWHLARN